MIIIKLLKRQHYFHDDNKINKKVTQKDNIIFHDNNKVTHKDIIFIIIKLIKIEIEKINKIKKLKFY